MLSITILGLKLFLFYINDIYSTIFNGKFLNYADDCVILNRAKNLKDLIFKVNEDLKNFNTWCFKNHLKINCDKTKYMIFSLKKRLFNLDIRLHKKIVSTLKDVTLINLNKQKVLSILDYSLMKISLGMYILINYANISKKCPITFII